MGETPRFTTAGRGRSGRSTREEPGRDRAEATAAAPATAAAQNCASTVSAGQRRVVSFDDEPLILVDRADREVGHLDKAAAHRGAGRLHRAFSVFVFNSRGELLLQKRAAGKRLWPGFWSNTCCSHPRRGEVVVVAAHRRLIEELGFDCPLDFLFKFEYQAQFDDDGAEHELCWVYSGEADEPARFNPNEIEAVRYLSPESLDAEIASAPGNFTPWFLIEWRRIRASRSDPGEGRTGPASDPLTSSAPAAAGRAP